jgi:hypothetical protein
MREFYWEDDLPHEACEAIRARQFEYLAAVDDGAPDLATQQTAVRDLSALGIGDDEAVQWVAWATDDYPEEPTIH